MIPRREPDRCECCLDSPPEGLVPYVWRVVQGHRLICPWTAYYCQLCARKVHDARFYRDIVMEGLPQ